MNLSCISFILIKDTKSWKENLRVFVVDQLEANSVLRFSSNSEATPNKWAQIHTKVHIRYY